MARRPSRRGERENKPIPRPPVQGHFRRADYNGKHMGANPLTVRITTSRSALGLVLCLTSLATIAAAQPYRLQSLEARVLSTMLADTDGIGEWGFAALIAADGHRILFDPGARPETGRNNARELKVDLTNIPDVVLSHSHGDHTGGLVTLRRWVRDGKNPAALAVTHVARGSFGNVTFETWLGAHGPGSQRVRRSGRNDRA